ncbi:DUF4123 domain-containing protein [Chitiniphilus purpureus]|uniref:DUF4123 domain-containing protein n=1 Tax=Chitiniphilus purpureus TaxID=2981137 RepID=A0ABY6DRF7_9NEIS|nr:DUF4123 domain-containing protein [Chitiniphilus sp. CD1]UXY16959.1 DUF4123 domain-containing protein [Chitiniphilus sp. CD1]
MSASLICPPLSCSDAPAFADALLPLLHQQSGRALLLLDPALRPPLPGDPLAAALENGPWLPIGIREREVDPALIPLLIELDLHDATGVAVLRASVAEAWAENQPQRLARGEGRRICGWLSTPFTLAQVARHLGALCVQTRPDGRRTLLRLFDPAVTAALDLILTAPQRMLLLGPCSSWLYLDGERQLGGLQSDTPRQAVGGIGWSNAQWADLDLLGAANLALLALREAGLLDDASYAPARQAALPALRRAAALGFGDAHDLSHFARHALTLHPAFDSHPVIRARLTQRAPDDYYTALIADLTEADWQQIRAMPAAPTPHHSPT